MGKKNRRRDDDEDPMAEQLKMLNLKAAEAAGCSEDEAPKASKKEKKKTKGGNKGGDSDNEDEPEKAEQPAAAPAPVSKGKKGKKGKNKGGDSDDEDVVAAPAPAEKNGKKGKKGKKGRQGDSSDEDVPQKKAPTADDEEPVEQLSRKDKRKAKKASNNVGGGRKRNDSDDEDPLVMMARLAAQDSEEDEDEDEEEEVLPPQPPVRNKKEKKKSVQPESETESEEEEELDDDSEEESEDEPEEVVVVEKAPVEKKGKMSKAERKKQKQISKMDPAEKEREEQAERDILEAKSKKIAENADKPKSKLEQKLQKARLEKEANEAAAAEQKVIDDKIEEKELKKKKKEEKKKLKEAAERGEDVTETSSKAIDTGKEVEEDTDADKEARMLATMYGDDVHSEWGNTGAGSGGKSEAEFDETPGKKVSRKELKRRAAEADAKVREEEYNKAALKASMEGAQFAVSQTIIDPNDPQWQNALDIVIPSISISAHKKELFVNTELMIAHGRRYGLVGPNGAGKSTLLKMISAGELKIPPKVDYLYVEQEVHADETTAVDAVLKSDKVRWALVEEETELLADIEKNGPSEKKDERLGQVYEQLEACGASSAEAKARRILFGLGFDAEMQVRSTKYFSGGWRMRISLARALFIEPTLLMLDEPTNHLDLNAVIWLDDYLQKWKKTLLVVSHDQDFLNSVCQEILHLDSKKLNTYKGNYDNFKDQEKVKRKQLMKAWDKQERKLKELKKSGQSKANAEKNQLKTSKREPGARAKKAAAKEAAGQGGQESAENQLELIARPKEYQVQFSFPEINQVSPPILEVRDVNFRYAPNLPQLFKNLSFGLDMDSRVCIVGPNGSGKSTILKIITGDVDPPEGEVRRNPRLRVGVYNQHFMDKLPMDEDPVTYLRRLFEDETYQSVRNMLGRYGLEGHAHTIPIRDLSGGQKARVVFVELSLMAPHLLFLDEPTNNLDIESIDALCDALKEYQGGVILVSHDARLIETCDCQLWVVEDQNVWPWESGFDGYRAHLLKKLEDQLSIIMAGSGERPDQKHKE